MVEVGHVPSAEDHPSIVGVRAQGVNDPPNLIDSVVVVVVWLRSTRGGFCLQAVLGYVGFTPMAPLVAVHGTEFALDVLRQAPSVQVVSGGVAVPNVDVVAHQGVGVGAVALEKPQEFLGDPLEVHLLGGEHGKSSVAQIEAK